MTGGTLSAASVVIQNGLGGDGDFEIRQESDQLCMRFREGGAYQLQDALAYRQDHWEFGKDLQVDGDVTVTGKVVMGALGDASDVEYTGVPQAGQVLAWAGAAWTNQTMRTAYWTETFHYGGNMAGSAVSMVTGAGNTLSVAPPYTFSVDTLSISAYNLPDASTHAFAVAVKKHDGTTLATLSSGPMPQRTVMGVRAAWANVSVAPFAIGAGDTFYLQLSGYTGTGIGVGDYSGAAPQSLVPRSYVFRAPAFLYGLNHSSVTTPRITRRPPTPAACWSAPGRAVGAAGGDGDAVLPPAPRVHGRHTVGGDPDARVPVRLVRLSSRRPGGGGAERVPHTASTCIYEVAVCLNNLQIGSGGGGNLITVTVRVHDTAVDTGLYEDEVYRQTDVASEGGQRERVLRRRAVELEEGRDVGRGGHIDADQRDHSLTMSGGDNWAVLCRVYSASKAGLAAGDIYTKSGRGRHHLVASSFPMSGDGTVGSGPLVFSSLTPSTAYYVYVVAGVVGGVQRGCTRTR
eukprot:jgi/Mesvir1/17219/Mv07633-RA.1